MGSLKINKDLVTKESGEALVKICPFGAIGYNGGELEISSACKMCRMCVKKGPRGVVEYIEEEKKGIDRSQYRGVMVYVDHNGGEIHRVTYELIGKARELAAVTRHPVYALMIGTDIGGAAQELLHYGVDKVFVYDNQALRDFRIEPYTVAFCDFIEKIKPSSVLVGATNLGRQLAPRVAARCKSGLTADCTILRMRENTDLVQIRPAFGGNIMAEIISPNTRPQFCTARYKVFTEPKRQPAASGEIVDMSIDESLLGSAIEIISKQEKPKDIDISESDIIVAIGRGCNTESLREMAQRLADALGGMLACTRPLVESGIMDAKRQIGLSGRTVKPKFIITLGISGAVQFASGMNASDCIVAVNTDANAPIFDVAHYAVVGDVGEILPRLLSKIEEESRNV